jgi:molybdate transport system permease protein
MLLFFLVPLLALVMRISPADLVASVADRQVAQAIQVSLVTTAFTFTATLVAGTPMAYLLARRQFRGRTLLDTLLDLPLVLPPAVAGIALLFTFGRFLALGWSYVKQKLHGNSLGRNPRSE